MRLATQAGTSPPRNERPTPAARAMRRPDTGTVKAEPETAGRPGMNPVSGSPARASPMPVRTPAMLPSAPSASTSTSTSAKVWDFVAPTLRSSAR